MQRYNSIQIGNTSRYVVVDSTSGFRVIYKNAPMAPVDESLAKVIAKALNEVEAPKPKPEPTSYECQICHGINHLAKMHCGTCGAYPAMYSMLTGQTAIEKYYYNSVDGEDWTIAHYLPINAVRGCERQRGRRTIKRVIRTVPLDYYATL